MYMRLLNGCFLSQDNAARGARVPPQGSITPSERPSTVQDSYHDAEEEHYHDDEEPNRDVQSEDANEQSDRRDAQLEGGVTGPYTDSELRTSRIPVIAPSLPSIDTEEGLELPSRVGSIASKATRHAPAPNSAPAPAPAPVPVPAVPLKSSRRSSQDAGRWSARTVSSEYSTPKGKEAKKSHSYWPAPPWG